MFWQKECPFSRYFYNVFWKIQTIDMFVIILQKTIKIIINAAGLN